MPEAEADPGAGPSPVPWPPLLIAGAVVGAVTLGRWWPLAWPGLDDAAAHLIGIGLGLAGIGLLAWAILTLRRHGTTVLPDAAATTLVTSGPYGYMRNPIYLADALILLGVGRADQEPLVRRRGLRVRPARHLACDPARGAPPRKALRQGLPRLQGEDAQVVEGCNDHRLRREGTRLHRRAQGEHRARSRGVAGGDLGQGPSPPQRHHRLAAPAGLHVLQGVVAGAHPPQRRPSDLRRCPQGSTSAPAREQAAGWVCELVASRGNGRNGSGTCCPGERAAARSGGPR